MNYLEEKGIVLTDQCSDFEFWNFTYTMPEGSKEVPRIRLEFEVV